ncbi:serine/threonine-protein phosphatase [Streptomyces sp. JH14]|uniref:ATP-binding SpoIIE family protein phosphatase n=1 Tax=Streptomyces sp. JH14 TaxID=2793630 RepID=UPI0023F9D706|nr:ATP-binding SpoIIE family protein phosphatase [Streptomyces sp. JH14]MDF6045491.1 serine/threonine-protein phosphatase [Streptomyces sp. JH14]
MDSPSSAARPNGPTGPPLTCRDHVIAAALRRLNRRLDCSTCTAYLLTEDGRALGAAMMVDTTLSFTVPSGMAADDSNYASARAHQAGKVVLFENRQVRELTRRSPALFLHNPYAMMVAAAPVRTARSRFGVLSVRWVPPRPVADEALDYLQTVADDLAVELTDLAGRGASMKAPYVPLFIAEVARDGSARSQGTARDVVRGAAAESVVPKPTGSTFLYQLQRLAAELAAAVHIRDVLSATDTQVVRPFGGHAVMLCLAEQGRLHVVGAAGFSRESVQRVEGTLLSRRTPETDTLRAIEIHSFPSAQALRDTYPDVDPDPEAQARAYLPLVSNGRAMGCCVLEFPEPAPPFAPEQLAVLTIMLEQVGQSLERARSYESEQALTQTLQRSLLPRSLPHLTEAVATARYLPATERAEVGGDWYDIVPLPGGGIGLVIGDVEGHSLEAVAVMGQLRSGVRAYAAEGHDPATVLERSNRLLAGLDTDLYATCCCVWLDLASGTAATATAGHPHPLIVDAGGKGSARQLPVGPPLGVDAHARYEQCEAQVSAGSVIALFTDGLLDGRLLGSDAAMEKLGRVLAEHCGENLEVLADRLVQDRRGWRVLADDAALLLVRYEGAQPREHRRMARMSVQRHHLQGVAQVRDFLRDLLREWDMEPLLDTMELLTSEVVTNALIHADSEVELRLREYPDRIRVEVRDSDPHPPVPTAIVADEENNQEAESGRGLLIVDALAGDWGSSPAGRGKTTWFDIGVAAE